MVWRSVLPDPFVTGRARDVSISFPHANAFLTNLSPSRFRTVLPDFSFNTLPFTIVWTWIDTYSNIRILESSNICTFAHRCRRSLRGPAASGEWHCAQDGLANFCFLMSVTVALNECHRVGFEGRLSYHRFISDRF